jgi:hypothetical protein
MSVGFNSIENSCNPIVIRPTLQSFSARLSNWFPDRGSQVPGPRYGNFHPLKNSSQLDTCSAAKVMAYSGYGRISVPSGTQSPGMEPAHRQDTAMVQEGSDENF